MAKEVLPSSDAWGNCESDFAFVRNHAVDAPALVGGNEAILINLEPFEASHIALLGIGNLRAGILCGKLVFIYNPGGINTYRYETTGPWWEGSIL